MADVDKWERLRLIVEQAVENTVRRVVREEVALLVKPAKSKVGFKNGQWTGIGEIELAALEAAYPAVNVGVQLKEAAAWCLMHPNDAPRSNFGAFLNTWLKKHQDRHALRSIPMNKPEVKQRHCSYCPKVSTGAPNNIPACDEHFTDAMDQKPRGHMWGVQAKPVAGRD